MKYTLSDGEWKLMNLLWEASPRTIAELVRALENDTGWTKATVNIMLTRLAEKGAVTVDATGRSKLFSPVLGREEAVRQEARSCLEKVRHGGLGLLLSAMTEDCALSEAEIAELTRILKEARHA